MSKFDTDWFYGGFDQFAVSKEKYTLEQAVDLYLPNVEHELREERIIAVGSAWVKHRAGINEDGEPCVGWWIEYKDTGRNCEAWVFHLPHERNIGTLIENGYEYCIAGPGLHWRKLEPNAPATKPAADYIDQDVFLPAT